jgi:iron complex outermembrane receptor protein
MKIDEAPGLDIDRQRKSRRWLRSHTGLVGSIFARTASAYGAGAACALWVSLSAGQTPPPADNQPPAGEAPAPTEAAPTPPPEAPPAADAPAADAPPADAPGASDATPEAGVEPEPEAMDVDMDPAPSGMDEVVVTVDRRRKNLQDYSGTAAAFSEQQLRNVGLNNVTQLSQVVPGMQIGANDQGSTTIYIRGVGSDNTTELGDPAVAVHLDNVYLPRFRGLSAAFLDVQRVEVNSGPQGTVRGRNAVGGSVNIISNPAVLGEYQANAEITFGTYRQRTYQGMVNIPFGDKVALRAAGMSSSIDPLWENAGPLDHLPGAQDTNDYAFKGALRWKPTAKWDITLAGDYNLQRNAGWLGANMIGLIQNLDDRDTPFDLSDDVLAPIDPNSVDNPRRVFQRGRYPEAFSEVYGARLNVNYDAGPVTFVLLASHRYMDWQLKGGSTAGWFYDPEVLPDQTWDDWSFAQQQHNDSKSEVGELRIASSDDQRLVWSVGLFGFYEDQGSFLGQVTGDANGGGFNEFNMPSTVGWSYAAYGDATFKVTESFRVLAGLRYSVEHKDRLGGLWMIGSGLPQNGAQLCAEIDNTGACTDNGLAGNFGRYGTEGFRYKGLDRKNYTPPTASSTTEERVNFFLDGIESFGARDQTAISLCNDPPTVLQTQTNPEVAPVPQPADDRLTLNADGNFRCTYGVRPSVDAADGLFTNPVPQNGERDDSYADFRLGVEYDLTKDSLLYATLSSGHKAGGFNDTIPDPDSAGGYLTPDYGPEKAYALEIGSKNLLADRKLRLNASAFAFVYDALQFQTIITVGEAPPLDPNTGDVAIDPNTGMQFDDNRGGAAARQNAENTATAYGLDLDAVYSLPLGLEVDFHALLMDARFPDDTLVNDGRLGLNQAPAQVDIGGYWLPRVSPYTFNYSLSQLIFTPAGSFDWIIQGQTTGPQYMTPYNGNGRRFAPRGPSWGINPDGTPSPIEADDPMDPDDTFSQQYNVIARNLRILDDRVPTHTSFNFGLGWKRTDGMLSVRFFVNNVFNIAYANNIISTAANNIRFYNDPRMAGVRVRMEF